MATYFVLIARSRSLVCDAVGDNDVQDEQAHPSSVSCLCSNGNKLRNCTSADALIIDAHLPASILFSRRLPTLGRKRECGEDAIAHPNPQLPPQL